LARPPSQPASTCPSTASLSFSLSHSLPSPSPSHPIDLCSVTSSGRGTYRANLLTLLSGTLFPISAQTSTRGIDKTARCLMSFRLHARLAGTRDGSCLVEKFDQTLLSRLYGNMLNVMIFSRIFNFVTASDFLPVNGTLFTTNLNV